MLDRFSKLYPIDKFLVVGCLALMALMILYVLTLDISPIRTGLGVLTAVVMVGFYPFMILKDKG